MLNDEGHHCDLATYSFKGHLLDFSDIIDLTMIPFLEKSGEFLPNTCGANRPNYSGVYSGDVVQADVVVTDPTETTPLPTETGLNAFW